MESSWQWQLSNRLNTAADFERIGICLTASERAALNQDGLFRVDITPYFASLIDKDNPDDPIRKQVIPTMDELSHTPEEMEDSEAEVANTRAPGLIHRYPDRVLILTTTQCASYCRYCFRARIVGNASISFPMAARQQQIDYIREHDEIRDVVLSGGDPMTINEKILFWYLDQLASIDHLAIIRIHTRVPIFLPMRITNDFVSRLKDVQKALYVVIHSNHPREITDQVQVALARLSDAGIPLANQNVLLAGINDSIETQRELCYLLLKNKVRPYYLYQADVIPGTSRFRTSVAKGIGIMEGLRGHISGLAIPTYVIDSLGGGGKIPIAPNYIVSMGEHKVILRNFEGLFTTYVEPGAFDATTEDVTGIAALSSGKNVILPPEGWREVHGVDL